MRTLDRYIRQQIRTCIARFRHRFVFVAHDIEVVLGRRQEACQHILSDRCILVLVCQDMLKLVVVLDANVLMVEQYLHCQRDQVIAIDAVRFL